MSEKLALLSISPVQSYIFKSRKAVDLFNGSKIISDLIIFIIKTINASNKVKFIYPQIQYILNTDNLDGNENEINVSNKIIFRFNGAETEAQISKLIEKLINKFVEERVKDQFKKENKEHEEYQEKIKEFFKENFKIIILIKNIDFKQPKDKADNFLNVLKKLYRDLESQKNYFDFENNIKALDIEAQYENCTLCGIRAGKILKTEFFKNKIDDKERLCYPCYFKRDYLSKNYISTMDVALLPYYFKFKGEKDFETYLKTCFKDKNSALMERFNKCRASIFYFDDTKEITEELRNFYKNHSKPSNYFAIIKADIDDLGKHLSGEFLTDEETSLLESYQKKLSCEINNIAKDLKEELIRDYFDNKIDLSIYMGGDDYLFFIEIHKIVNILEKLDKKIDELNKKLGYDLNDKKKLTLSKSIAISNNKVPFNKVLRLLSNGLDKAKNKHKEKNGICYTLIDSLSRMRQAVFKNDKKALTNLDEIKLYFKNDLSKSVIHDLERILKPLGSYYNFDEFIDTKSIIDSEIKRIIKRKVSKKENVESIYKNMIYLLSLFVYLENTDYFIDLNSYFEMLKILAKLSTEEV